MANPILPVIALGAVFLFLGRKGDGDADPEETGDEPDLGQGGERSAPPGDGQQVLVMKSLTAVAYDPNATPTPTPTPTVGGDVPGTAYCADVDNWDPAWVAMEEAILVRVNEVRAQGYTCPAGTFPPAPPLTMNQKLRCSARKHSVDMGDRNYFNHTNPEGLNSWDRMRNAGYDYSHATENIAAGYDDLNTVMQQWLTSQMGHCDGIMDRESTEIGIGYYPKPGSQFRHYWTQNFGNPA